MVGSIKGLVDCPQAQIPNLNNLNSSCSPPLSPKGGPTVKKKGGHFPLALPSDFLFFPFACGALSEFRDPRGGGVLDPTLPPTQARTHPLSHPSTGLAALPIPICRRALHWQWRTHMKRT